MRVIHRMSCLRAAGWQSVGLLMEYVRTWKTEQTKHQIRAIFQDKKAADAINMRCAACWRWSVTRPSVSSPTSDTVIVIGTALMPVIKELTLRPWVHCKFMALIWAIRAVCTPWDIVSDTCFHVMLCFIQQGLAHTLHLFSHVCGRISRNRKLTRIIRETDQVFYHSTQFMALFQLCQG